ncbi:BlaI/MecI/CopY family transcriptional regulator [Paraferrimonas sp. SM1919]|uniref:BlaI/MecI/CopY family transcriptional regulator n=1 Tax=Paraferrimonas sp. SM1919 TaxID=2662263 RepID=UPI0013D609DC|nr:BlaI/MecI/CopY family transcriptional regulator [Paraferrimonas sp. SM1919]
MIEVSKTEEEVLNALWQAHPTSASELITRLNQTKPWHEKTAKTLLNRLVKKQAVGFEKQGRSYLYFPLIEKQDYAVSQSQGFLDRLFNGKLAPLVAGFSKTEQLKREDIDELKQIIKDWEQKND